MYVPRVMIMKSIFLRGGGGGGRQTKSIMGDVKVENEEKKTNNLN